MGVGKGQAEESGHHGQKVRIPSGTAVEGNTGGVEQLQVRHGTTFMETEMQHRDITRTERRRVLHERTH